jgi:hypothetical protein
MRSERNAVLRRKPTESEGVGIFRQIVELHERVVNLELAVESCHERMDQIEKLMKLGIVAEEINTKLKRRKKK